MRCVFFLFYKEFYMFNNPLSNITNSDPIINPADAPNVPASNPDAARIQVATHLPRAENNPSSPRPIVGAREGPIEEGAPGRVEELAARTNITPPCANIDAYDAEGRTALYRAVESNDLEEVERLIAVGANVNLVYYGEVNILSRASMSSLEIMQALLNAPGCNIPFEALRSTVLFGRSEMLQSLLNALPHDENRNDYLNRTLINIVEDNRVNFLPTIIRAGADLNITVTTTISGAVDTIINEGLLSFALRRSSTEMVRELLRGSVRPNEGDDIDGLLNRARARGLENDILGVVDQRMVQTIELTQQINHVPRHRILNNKLYLNVNRLNMTPDIAKEQLHLLAEYLRQYKDNDGDFARLGLNVQYEGEQGVDAGGLSRDFMGHVFDSLFAENPFFAFVLENGCYKLSNENSTSGAADLNLCKDIGVLMAAIFSGFPKRSQAKIGGVFTDRFYNQLLATYKYAQENPLVPFNSMTKEEKVKFTKTISDYDLENTIYKNIQHDFQKETLSHEELDAIAHFLMYDMFEGGDSIDEELTELFGEFAAVKDCLKWLGSPQPEEVMGQDGKVYNRTLLRNKLRTVLENADKISLYQKFIDSRTETYSKIAIPLAALGEGFNSVTRNKITPFITQLGVDPSSAVEAVCTEIQGPAFSRENFVSLLKRSIINDSVQDKEAMGEKLAWLIEWCARGVHGGKNGSEEMLATEKEMKDTLCAFTGSAVIGNELKLEFKEPLSTEGSFCDFHTCFNYMHPGKRVMNKTEKIEFIQEWIRNIDEALASGFSSE